MNREVHVRFWERAEVKFLRATRHFRRWQPRPLPLCFRSTPKADIASTPWPPTRCATYAPQQIASLFDHLVGAGEQRRRHFEAECLGDILIDHQLEFARLQNRRP